MASVQMRSSSASCAKVRLVLFMYQTSSCSSCCLGTSIAGWDIGSCARSFSVGHGGSSSVVRVGEPVASELVALELSRGLALAVDPYTQSTFRKTHFRHAGVSSPHWFQVFSDHNNGARVKVARIYLPSYVSSCKAGSRDVIWYEVCEVA
jgi:hypothetical protein